LLDLDRDVSDYCPLVLRYSSRLWGPKPFRFNNFWLDHPGLSKIVAPSWGSRELVGWLAVRLSEKFKRLKSELKRWNVEVFGNLEFRISQLVEHIKILDLKENRRSLL